VPARMKANGNVSDARTKARTVAVFSASQYKLREWCCWARVAPDCDSWYIRIEYHLKWLM